MSYDPYSSAGYAPPLPQEHQYGGPPASAPPGVPPHYQTNSRRESNDYNTTNYNQSHGYGGSGGGGPPPPRGRPGFSPPLQNNEHQYQGYNSRVPPPARRRSASPNNRYGGEDHYAAASSTGGPGYRRDRGTRGGRGRFRDDRGGGDSFGRRRDDDENSAISNRAKEERPGRILFVRNLKFGVTPEEVRAKFAEIGDIKTFFDLVEKRAMAFITYYDARAAMMAKDRLHNSLLQGRPMDVHFSLPRDADLAGECDREKGQGTLSLVILPFPGARINQALPPPTDSEVYARFSPFGDLKQVFPSFKRQDMRYIEFYDSRGTCLAYDQIHGSRLAGGIADLRFVWDKYPMDHSKPPPGARRDRERFDQDRNERQPSSYGSDRYGGNVGGPGGYGGGPPPPTGPAGGSAYGAPPALPPLQGPYSGFGPSSGSRFDGPPPPPPGGAYGRVPPGPVPTTSSYGYNQRSPLPPPGNSTPYDHQNPYQQQQAPPQPSPHSEAAHGVEQAKKMQDLLASLMANPSALSSVLPPSGSSALPAPATAALGQSPLPPTVAQSPSLQAPSIPAPPPLGAPSQGEGNSTPLPPAVSSLLAQAGVPPQQQQPYLASPTRPTPPQQQQNQPEQAAPQPMVGNSQVQALLALLASQKAQSG